MFRDSYSKFIEKIVDLSIRRHNLIFVITALITLPCFYLISQIGIDADLLKLLPTDNPAYLATMKLQDKMGDGGHFIVIFEGAPEDKLKSAVEYAAKKIRAFSEVKAVHCHYPTEFISKYKYLLIPNDYLQDLYDRVVEAEAKANPLADMETAKDSANKTNGEIENEQDFSVLIRQYASLTDYHQSADGKIFGMLIPTKQGITNLGDIKALQLKIDSVNKETERIFHAKAYIAGNHANKLIDYDTITNDVSFASTIAFILIVALLFYSFRSPFAVILTLYPLILGLIWAFALVPLTFGSLNLITSFLTVILFGLGADYPIHIIKRFQIEIQTHDLREALILAFDDTGMSVIMSALTTAAGFIVAVFSHFRGFFEFGVLSSLAIIAILLAMFIPFPAALIIAWKRGGLKKMRPVSKRAFLPKIITTSAFVAISIVGVIFTVKDLGFDYYISNTEFKKDNYKNYQEINRKVEKVYSASMSPAALYAVHGVRDLDSCLAILNAAKNNKNTEINRVRSIRDFAPDSIALAERISTLKELKEILSGAWTGNIKDENLKSFISDFLKWEIPAQAPSIAGIPDIISDNLLGNKGAGLFLINVFPVHERKDGRVAIALNDELSKLNTKSVANGPVGESIVFADVLKLVLGEAWQIVLWGQLLVFLVVLAIQRNFKESLLMFIPLISGLIILFGIYGLLGIKLTFFSVICIPSLMGMGVDGGIHYINRWRARNGDLRQTQKELFEPLSSSFLTVIFGYIGMAFSSHSGLQSIGLLSALGMFCIWATNLLLLPGLLRISKFSTNENK
jgi:predicted RND superfamily exporter protein